MRFGLIGTGYWAQATHGPAILAHPGASLAGVWGRDPGRAQAAAAGLGVRAYPSLDELLGDVDAVALAVPPDVQAGLAVRAAEQGRHLLLDKPLALAGPAADRVVRAAATAGVRGVVFFTMRYTANIAAWLDTLDDEDWVASRVRIFTSIFDPPGPYSRSAWRRSQGALWDVGPHALSILLPVLGPAESVVAQRGPGDGADLVVRHVSGATSTLSLSLTAPPGARGDDWQLFGTRRSATMPRPAQTALEAMGCCLSALLEPGDRDPRGDLTLGRDIVAVLAAAQQFLGRRQAAERIASPAG
jgi:predicted dehydrogenase